MSAADRFRRHALAWILWVPVVAIALWLVLTWMPGTFDPALLGGRAPKAADFQHFFYAAEHVWQGKSPYTSFGGGYVYPPLLATVLAPLTPLGIEHAAKLWFAIDVLAVVAILWLSFMELSKRFCVPRDRLTVASVTVVTLVLGLEVVRRQLSYAQTDTFVLLCFVGALACMDRSGGRALGVGPILCGLLLAISLHIKFLAIVFLAFLLVTRRFSCAAWMIAWAVALALSTSLVFGWEQNLDHLARSSSGAIQLLGLEPPADKQPNVHMLLWHDSISIPSAVGRVLEGRFTGEVNKDPENAGVVALIVGVIGLACLALAWWMHARRRMPLFSTRNAPAPVGALHWGAALAVILAFSPQTTKVHTFAGLPLLMMGAMFLLSPRRSVNLTWLVLGLIVLQGAQYLPPRDWGVDTETGRPVPLDMWNAVGGLGWAWLAYFFALLWTGLQYTAALQRGEPSAWKSPGVNEPLGPACASGMP